MITLLEMGRWVLAILRQRTVAQEMLSVAQGYIGLKEDKPNAGPVIDRWLAAVGASSPNNWCAASVAHWLRTACRNLGVLMPIAGSMGAKATKDQFIAAKCWLTADQVRANPKLLRVGMVPVWHRGKPGAWTGHIGVLEELPNASGVFRTVEGNSGPGGTEVARMGRSLNDPNLLGFGWVD